MLFIKTIIAFLNDKDYREILISTSVVITMGTVFYHFQEGWGWLDSLYFSVITLTTIGYGDFSPATDLGKVFTIFYIVIGLGMILTFIQIIYSHFNEIKITGVKRNLEEEDLDKKETM